MKTLERKDDKIKKICDQLREETLEPARVEAERIVAEAREQAQAIIQAARQQAEQMHQQMQQNLVRERTVFESTLRQAAKQVIEQIRQQIEQQLFRPELRTLIEKQASNPILIAHLIESFAKALEKNGIYSNLEVLIPETVPAQEVVRLLAKQILQRIKGQALQLSGFQGGAQVLLQDQNIMFDMSDQALKELVISYIRKDLRHFFFEQTL